MKPIVLDEKLPYDGTRQGHTSLGGDAPYNKMVDEKGTPGREAIERRNQDALHKPWALLRREQEHPGQQGGERERAIK